MAARWHSVLLLSVCFAVLVLLSIMALVAFPLQIDTGMGAFTARDLPMASINDAYDQARFQSMAMPSRRSTAHVTQPSTDATETPARSTRAQNTVVRQSHWRWAITIIYEAVSYTHLTLPTKA